MGHDPWGFEVERTGDAAFENPNYGPDASICAQSAFACTPKQADVNDTFWWGHMPDEPSGASGVPKVIKSVLLPAVPYTGGTLNSTAGGSGWSATVVWSPAHTATALGTAYTATFTLTPTGKNYFDPDAPPTVSVSTSNGSGGTVSSAVVVGDNEDGNVATMEITVVYSAVVNKPVAPPAGMFGYRGIIHYTNPPSQFEGGTFSTDDAVFDYIEPVTKAQAQTPWFTEPYTDQDDSGRPFYLLTQKPSNIQDVTANASSTSNFTSITTVTINGMTLTGYIWTGLTVATTLRADF